MTNPGIAFPQVLDRVRAGCDESLCELLQAYRPLLAAAIRKRLNSHLRSLFDVDDFLQIVWARFLLHELPQRTFQTVSHLTAFLRLLTRNAVLTLTRQQLASQKFNRLRDLPLDEVATLQGTHPVTPSPSPLDLALGEDEWRALLQGQPEHGRLILTLLRAGHTHVEVATQLQLNEKTVRRVVQRALARWKARAG